MMYRVRIRELALVAVAGGLLAFEAIGLRGALPAAMRSLAGEGALDAVKAASRGAAVATASVLEGAGASATGVAVGAAKGAARFLGAATPPRQAMRHLVLTTRDGNGSSHACVDVARDGNSHAYVHVVTLTEEARRAAVKACRSARRAHAARRARETTGGPSTL